LTLTRELTATIDVITVMLDARATVADELRASANHAVTRLDHDILDLVTWHPR